MKDFAPISSIGTFDCLFIVNASSPYKTLADWVKAAREQPGKLNVGTITAGSTQHLTAELFKSSANLNFVIVPTKTSGEAVVSLLRDDVHMVIDFYAALRGTVVDGKARALAWSGPVPSPAMPEVPAAAQTVPGFEVISWNSMSAPAGTPQAVIDTLNKALREVLADPALKKRALEMGIDLKASTPAEAQRAARRRHQEVGCGDHQGGHSEAVAARGITEGRAGSARPSLAFLPRNFLRVLGRYAASRSNSTVVRNSWPQESQAQV